MSRHKHRHSHKHGHKRKHGHKHDSFKIIYKDCGTGRTKVSIVKRKSDGRLLIWKRARSEGSRSKNFYKNDIKKSKLWRKFGISTVKACVHPDKKSVLRTYIKGSTLTQVLKKNPEFFSGSETEYRNALIGFIKLLIDSGHYIHDMKGANIVFGEGRWQVIDSGKADEQKNRSDVVHEYRENLMEKWSRSLHSENEVHYLELFLDKYCV
jgi:hypothetical protein